MRVSQWWNWLWPQAPEPEQVTVATRSPTKPRQQQRRSKRGRADTTVYCPPDLMNEGTERIASARTAVIEEYPETGQLRVCFPQKRRKGESTEEYPWIESQDELRNAIAIKGYANDGATLLALAMDEPGLFWNAVHHYEGDLERIERELLLVL